METTIRSVLESLPRTGQMQIAINVTASMNISACAARQKVNTFVLSEISYMLHAGEAVLVVADRLRWRVPVILSLTSRGDVGEVGAIDVDVENGHLHVTPELMEQIDAFAESLALRATSQPTR